MVEGNFEARADFTRLEPSANAKRESGFFVLEAMGEAESGFDADVADTADEIVGGSLVSFHGHELDGVSVVMGTKNEVLAGDFDIPDGASAVLANGVHVGVALAVRSKGIVMAIEENGSTGQEAGIHAHALAGIDANDDKTFPGFAAGLEFGTEAAEERAAELEQAFDAHVHDEGFGSRYFAVDNKDIVELVIAGRGDAGALVDLVGVEQVEDREALNVKDLVHALEAKAALAVEEIGNVGLAEAGFLGEAKAGQFSFVDAFPKPFAEVLLQSLELHGRESIAEYISFRL